ncbi:MAG: hypothetical protein Q8K81_05230, partial [Sulfuricurvum sp.]|nr:hypothetical protein [Sulfuricurvum sp.]
TILTDYLIEQGKILYTLNEEEMNALNEILPSNWSRNNPVDIIGDAMADRYEKTLKIVTMFESVDLIYVVVTPQHMTDSLAIAQLCEREWGKKIYPILLGGHEMEEAARYLASRQKLFFKTLQSATSFL